MTYILVDVEQGKLKGTTGSDYHAGKFYKFLGIPYAKAPVGDLRFKAPQPPEPWSGIRDATKEGPECPSADMYFTYFVGNEDNCLNLNVYTKELPKENNSIEKPVMVWIHGGAFTCGSNKSDLYGPDYLMTEDIVLVNINYRLGILGFASFKDPSLEVPGNAGLKDMRMALKWVQKNIKKFGGNPHNVTIFGESAGGASVSYLTLSPSTKGLFHKAIIQSGSALNNWSWGKTNSAEIAKYMAYKDADEKTILERLRRESARSIINGQSKVKELFAAGKIRPWGPVVEPPSEDAILTEHPNKIMHSRGGHKIPMIIGYNSGEGIFFELVRRTVPGVGLPKNLELEIPFELGLEEGTEKSKEVAEKIKKAYFGDNGCNEKDIDKLYTVNIGRTCTNKYHVPSCENLLRRVHLKSIPSLKEIPISITPYKGQSNFRLKVPINQYMPTGCHYFLSKMSSNYLPIMKNSVKSVITKLPKKEFEGVVHADDLLYLFPTFFTPTIKPGSEEDLYIQRFVKMWTNFARYGEPTPEENETLNKVKWKPVAWDNIEFLDIGHELKMIENVDAERLKFWDALYETHLKF